MHSVFWFRKSLRLADNAALMTCIKRSETVFPVYILDKWHSDPMNIGSLRFEFIMQSLRDLDKQLQDKGVKCGLLFLRGEPETLLPQLMKTLKAGALGFDSSEEQEIHSREVDRRVIKLSSEAGIELKLQHSHWLHSPETYKKHLSNSNVPLSMGQFSSLFRRVGPVPKPMATPESIPFNEPKSVELVEKLRIETGQTLKVLSSAAEYKGLGREQPVTLKFKGGEQEGLRRLKETVVERAKWVSTFSKPDTSPNSLEPSTTVLSPYLTHGCVSARSFYHAIQDIYSSSSFNTKPPVSLHGQLMWRELWYTVSHFSGDDMSSRNNRFSRDIDWNTEGIESDVSKWANGKTGFPFVDAIMTQLRTEGWIHHLARHMVACFLTRGDLYISWTEGAKVFDRHLIDADWSLNCCNWMWVSCSSFFYQYFRCYSPVAFGKKTDPNGEFIKKYLPQLKNMPIKYIYEPWKAPKLVQEKANCIIGKDYPFPIVKDHTETSKRNMNRIKAAYIPYKSLAPVVVKVTDADKACVSPRKKRQKLAP